MLLFATLAASAASCSTTSGGLAGAGYRYSAERDHIGRIYHYLRSNRDGALPEHVHVFHSAKDRIEVYKMVQRCTNAALVTADLDREIWSASRLVGGRLGRNAEQIAFATLTFDKASKRLEAVVNLPEGAMTAGLQLQSDHWRQYDFDFAEFTVLSQHLARYDRAFTFEVSTIDQAAENFLVRLGEATATPQGLDERGVAWRYDLSGEAFPDGGHLILDAVDGHVVEVETTIPNHGEYDDFKLALIDVRDGGDAAWRQLLLSHFEGCPED
jgi:hypothetical protein